MSPKILLLAVFASVAIAADVDVTIYYESLCPDSMKFFKMQFGPVYTTGLKQHMKAHFVPWGKVNETTDPIICQHGQAECDGNRLQACAINVIPQNQTDILSAYITCLMSLGLPSNTTKYPIEECHTEARSNYENITACYNNPTTSMSYLKEFGAWTNTTFPSGIKGVPYVTINNKTADDVSAEAIKDLKATLCSNLKDLNLPDCSKSSASTFAATILPAAILFMLGRL